MIPGASNPLQPHIPASGAGAKSTDGHPSADEKSRDLEGDSKKFEHALKEEKTGKEGHGESGDDASGGQSDQRGESSPGDALLRSLFGGPPPLEKHEASPLTSPFAAPPKAQDNKLADLASQVAERMLVSDPSAGTNTEVRIIVKESILPATEIHISRQAGELVVRVVTQSQDVSNQLSPQQGALQAMLQERLPRETVRVEVDFGGAAGDESQRGTRNPRNVLEEEEEQKEQ